MFPNWTHWKTVKMILFILTTSAGAVAASNGDPSVKQSAAFATTLLGILGTLVVILSGTPVGPPMAKRAATVLAFAFLVSLGASQSACSGAQQSQAVNGGITVAACILETVAPDVAAGKSWSQCVEDAIAKCGADAVSIGQVWAAHTKAELVDGSGARPKMPAPLVDAGAAP